MIADTPLALRVREIEPLSPSLKRLVLELADGGRLPTSSPGAHLTLALSAGERLLRNAYSVVSHPEERSRYEIIVRRTEGARGGSAFIHAAVQAGAAIEATAPVSHFRLQSKARKHLLISGGVGATPILSFLSVLAPRDHPLEAHHFARRDEIGVFERLFAPHASHRVNVHAGRAEQSLAELMARQPVGTHVYVCGPETLMAETRRVALELGWPQSRIHQESFGAGGGAPFVVRIASTGALLPVGEHDTLLETLENAGLPAPSLCRGGACGHCQTRVLEGEPEHRDHYLTPAERGSGKWVMPCVSRSKTPILTLDL